MPFDDVEELKNPAEYKKILKTELGKVKAHPVKFQYFENFPFKGGAKPLVIVGPYKDDFIDKVKDTGAAFKAKGRCLERDDKLHFSADQGTLVEAKLNVALKIADTEVKVVDDLADAQGKAEVLAEPRAQGKVVSGPGGQKAPVVAPAAAPAAALAKAVAQFQALNKAFDTVKARMTDDERKAWRQRLSDVEAQLTPATLAAGLLALSQKKSELEKQLAKLVDKQTRDTEAEAAKIEKAHQEAKAVVDEAVAKATQALANAQAVAAKAETAAKNLVKQPQGMSRRDWDSKKAAADADLNKALQAVVAQKDALAKVPRDPKVDNAALADLEAKFLLLSKGLERASRDLAAVRQDAEGNLEPVRGKLPVDAGAAIERHVGDKGAIIAALKQHKAAVQALRGRWTTLAQRIETETGHKPDPQAVAPLVGLENDLAALLETPPRELAFEARFNAAGKTIGARLDAAEKFLGVLAQHVKSGSDLASRFATLAQNVASVTGAALDPAARQPLAEHEAAVAAARESLARSLGFSPTQLDAAPAKLTSWLDAAETTLQSLQKVQAGVQAQIDRFVQLEKSIAAATGLALDPAARAPRSDLETKLIAARREVARSLSFDPAALDEGPLTVRIDIAEAEVLKFGKSAAAVAALTTRHTALAQRYTAVTGSANALSNAALQGCQQQLTIAKQSLARTLTFDAAALDGSVLACENWIVARSKVLDEADARKVRKTYEAEVAKKANSNNALLPKLKAQLDALLGGANQPAANQLRKLFLLLAPSDANEQVERSKLNDKLEEESVEWGNKVFKSKLLQAVWKQTTKGYKGGDTDTITGFSLEEVEAAIPLWSSLGANAEGAASNFHTPGGGKPQFKHGKNPTRAVVQANFISQWRSTQVNVHVEITTCKEGTIGKGKDLDHPLLNKLITEARRINES